MFRESKQTLTAFTLVPVDNDYECRAGRRATAGGEAANISSSVSNLQRAEIEVEPGEGNGSYFTA